MEFSPLLLWCLVSISQMMTSYGMSQESGWCWNTVSSLITVRETYSESITVRTAHCCDWICLSTCSKFKVMYRPAYRDAIKVIYKIDMGCCPGWKFMDGHCVSYLIPVASTKAPYQPSSPSYSSGKSASGFPDYSGSTGGHNHLGQGGDTAQVDTDFIDHHQSGLPPARIPQEPDIYGLNKSRSEPASSWASSHPVGMAGIVGVLAIVFIVVLVGWTFYRRSLLRKRPHTPTVIKYVENGSEATNKSLDYQYEVLPEETSEGEYTIPPSTSDAGEPSEEQYYQNVTISRLYDPVTPPRRESAPPAAAAWSERESVYEITLPEISSNPRYTMLNIGDRQTPSTYTPLRVRSAIVSPTAGDYDYS